MNVSANLIALRKRRGLTQQGVADILNIKRTAYASYETGRVNMDIELLQKLAKYYSITIDAILNGSDVAHKHAGKTKNDKRNEEIDYKKNYDECRKIVVDQAAAIKDQAAAAKDQAAAMRDIASFLNGGVKSKKVTANGLR
jgi:transcriptional regulator with XRE-family HTH domain